MEKFRGIYIPGVDAKDILLADGVFGGEGFRLRDKNGGYNVKRFTAALDDCLDLRELKRIYRRKFRNNYFYFTKSGYKYSVNVINLTFKYSVKEWNQSYRNVYVKLGYDCKNLEFSDNIARNDKGEIVGIILDRPVKSVADDLPEYFKSGCHKEENVYMKSGEPKTVMSRAQLRKRLYKEGFYCDGVKYCRMKRSSGSARVGKCLFVNEKLYKPLMKFCSKGINVRNGQEIDLAAYESYIALTSSSIIGTLKIKPENILVIEDYESIFREDVVATSSEKGRLVTTEKNCEIKNNIWDGQSLIDKSAMGEYGKYGMVLLRNLMFKSCCFNTNIQKWFSDNGIREISQLNGITKAKRIEDIKLITTPSSIKYLKFESLDKWFDNMYVDFGVVKHDKKDRAFEGKLVQTHYQLLNTLQLTETEIEEFLQESFDFANLLRKEPAVVRYYIRYQYENSYRPINKAMETKFDVIHHLMGINDRFVETKFYKDFLDDLLKAYYKNMKNGHIFVNGNYSTLLGNPIEMLLQSIGCFDGKSQIGVGNIYSKRFEYGKIILGSRSPHVTMGNILLVRNTENDMIDRYLNLTEEIVCINSIGENILQRLSGSDFDADSLLLTDNEILIRAAKRNYNIFKTPTSFVTARKVKRYYTADEQADLDIKTSVNKIGEIVNLSQELNSLLWDRIYKGANYEDVKDLYYDICQLDVMSGIEIDKAKKEFSVDNAKELRLLREKYKSDFSEDNKKLTPKFFSHIARQKGYYNPERRKYVKYNTAMDYIFSKVLSYRTSCKGRLDKKYLPFGVMLDKRKYDKRNVNKRQINYITELIKNYNNECASVNLSDLSYSEKIHKLNHIFFEVAYKINHTTIGYSTMYELLEYEEKEERRNINKILLSILFLFESKNFDAILTESKEKLNRIHILTDDESFDKKDIIDMFGLKAEIV